MRAGRKKAWVGLAVVLVLTAMAAGAHASKRATATIVFGTEADPALMDPSLVSDGPSLRATDQIFNSPPGEEHYNKLIQKLTIGQYIDPEKIPEDPNLN